MYGTFAQRLHVDVHVGNEVRNEIIAILIANHCRPVDTMFVYFDTNTCSTASVWRDQGIRTSYNYTSYQQWRSSCTLREASCRCSCSCEIEGLNQAHVTLASTHDTAFEVGTQRQGRLSQCGLEAWVHGLEAWVRDRTASTGDFRQDHTVGPVTQQQTLYCVKNDVKTRVT